MAPKRKAQPSPPQPPPQIEDLFTSLNRHIERSEFQQASKIADQVLSIAPGNLDAVRCKVAVLIKSDNIDGALSAIQSYHRLPIDFSFFKAYCLYRKNKLNDALDCLKAQDGNSTTMLLESQILYRLGKLDGCADVCQRLQKSKIESLEINVIAGLVSAGKSSEVKGALEASRVKATSIFELADNVACSFIEENKLHDAEQLLLTAQRVGQEALTEESHAEDEIETELALISVQLAYVQQLLGQRQEASGTYLDTINRNLANESSLAVAMNNLTAVRGLKDASDSLRKLDRLKEKKSQNFKLAHALNLKLSPKQRETLYANRVLLLLHANKMDQARELIAVLPDLFPDSMLPILLQAAVFVRENKATRAEEILGEFAEKYPEKSKFILIARAQIAAAAGRPQVAAESLAKIHDIQHMPATVATLVALKERAGDIDGANAVIDSAIKWWSNAMAEDNKLNNIMQEAASFKLRHGSEEDTGRLYEELVKSHGSTEASVGLITTVAPTDVEKAEAYEKKLKPLPSLKGIDLDSLEKTSTEKHVEVVLNGGIASEHQDAKMDKRKKKRKRKPPKYPKGLDPTNPGTPPDRVRWLNKIERSTCTP